MPSEAAPPSLGVPPAALSALVAECAVAPSGLPVVNAADWLVNEPPPPEFMLDNVFEAGSRVLLVGSSKTRKSFLSLQLAICLATGKDFIGMGVSRPYRVILANLENAPDWQHRRLNAMCRTLGITCEMLGDRLAIMNGRGKGADLGKIEAEAVRHRADVVILDPLYKLDGGADESDMRERKELISRLEELTERTGAAVLYVHHDAKGRPGDRDIRDRGAGSSIINRDVDATLALTPWGEKNDPEAGKLIVLSVLSRNAPPHAEATLIFESGAFSADPEREPCKATSQNSGWRRRIPEGDPTADATTLAEFAKNGKAKNMTEMRKYGNDKIGDRRTRRALETLVKAPATFGVSVITNTKTGRGLVGSPSEVDGREKELGIK